MNYRKGDTVKVTDSLGKAIDATFLRLDYRKEPKHYAVELIRKTSKASKHGGAYKVWYLPANRFVRPALLP